MEAADIEERRVDNPLSTYAQFVAELTEGRPDPGIQRVQVNMRTLLGGFCKFRGNEAQDKAAARFKSIYERSQLGGAKAVDPGREPVDGGGVNPEATIENGADARRDYNRIIGTERIPGVLDRVELRRIEYVIVGEWGPTSYARWRNHVRTPNGKHVSDGMVEVRRIMDKLAVHFGYQTR